MSLPGGKRTWFALLGMLLCVYKPESASYISAIVLAVIAGESARPSGSKGLMGSGE